MKRAVAAPPVLELPLLPDDVMVEIMFYAFPTVGDSDLVTKEACFARRASPRFRYLIDRHLFGSVKKLSHEVLRLIDQRNVFLFHGLKKLKLFESCPHISESTLASMTSLESLTLFSFDHAGDRAIQKLTNLRKLVLYAYDSNSKYEDGKKHVTGKSLCMLTRLETLVICGRTMKDECIAHLHQLRHLHLRLVPVEGDCLTSLTRLESLYLGDTDVKEDSLKSLVHLKQLGLGCNRLLTNRSLSTLTGLVELTLDTEKISGDALKPFKDSLEVIKLGFRSIIQWQCLKECANLKEVHQDLFFNQLGILETQTPLEKGRGIKFIETSLF